jgi:hypothetical protein
VGWCGFLFLFTRQVMEDDRVAFWTVPLALWLLVRAYALNAHFMLYPFRETWCWLFMIAGWWLLVRGVTSRRYGVWLIASVCAQMLAVAIREPSIFGVIGLAAGCSVSRCVARRHWKWLLGPWMVAGVVLLCLAVVAGLPSQFHGWRGTVFGHAPGFVIRQSLYHMKVYLSWIPRDLGFLGLFLTGCGIWRTRKQPIFPVALLSTALLTLVFYSLFEDHKRYFLSVMIWIVPLAGAGAVQCVEWLAARLEQRMAGIHKILFGMVGLLLVFGLVRSVGGLPVWGPEVSRQQAHDIRQRFLRAGRSMDAVIADPRCRTLQEAVWTLTPYALVSDPAMAKRQIRRWGGGLFVEARNGACYASREVVSYKGVEMRRVVEHYGDLSEPGCAPASDWDFRLGEGAFRIFRVTPYSSNTVEQVIALKPGRDTILWLDFGDAKYRGHERVELLDKQGAPLAQWSLARNGGLQPLYLPRDVLRRDAVLRITADYPIPLKPAFAAVRAGTFRYFQLGVERRISVCDWFEAPFSASGIERTYGVVAEEGGVLALPPVCGRPALSPTVKLRYTMIRGEDQPLGVTVMAEGHPAQVFKEAPAVQHELEFKVPGNESGPLPVRILLESPNHAKLLWRVDAIAVKY